MEFQITQADVREVDELESLWVEMLEHHRELVAGGQGVGTALLEAIRHRLVERGITYWSIGVLADNPRAAKLYERVGFRPFTLELLAITDRANLA
jgi:ribosomal protein S18 acetylase RimI-like enzyme